MVTLRLFNIAGCIVLRKISYVNRYSWLSFSDINITSRFAFVNSKSWVSAMDWVSKWWSRLLSGNNNSKNLI